MFLEKEQLKDCMKIINECKKEDLIIVTKKLKLLNKYYLTDYLYFFHGVNQNISI